MPEFKVPIVARGKVIEDYSERFDGRYGGSFLCPDPVKYLPEILPRREEMEALYTLSLDEVVDFLIALRGALAFDKNEHLQWALELATTFNDLPRPLVENQYRSFASGNILTRPNLDAMIDTVGREHLDGWAKSVKPSGRVSYVRAFGVPTAHVIAGNGGGVSLCTYARNALIRGYAIIKVPSNELGAAIAVARTAIDMAPDHPLTKAVSAVYWRGGDERVEAKLYHPRNVERIVAWGGQASIKHISKYIRPGIDLMAFDPKISRVVIGAEAFASKQTMREAAIRLAADVGHGNQNGCAACRVAYIMSDGSEASLAQISELGHMLMQEIRNLLPSMSSEAKHIDPKFMSQLSGLSMLEDEYEVIEGGKGGGVIISRTGDQVDFADDLKYRHVNFVPVKSFDALYSYMTRDVQTVGVYPEALRDEIRVPLALRGVQRITSLGYMLDLDVFSNPHDGLEALRRSATWVLTEDCVSNEAPALWRDRLKASAA